MKNKKSNTHLGKLIQNASISFGLGNVVKFERLGGIANKNYLVKTTKGKYVFKILQEHTLKNLEKEVIYLNRLQQYKFPTTAYIISPSKKLVFEEKGSLVCVSPKINGKNPINGPDITKTVGRYLAKLHLIPYTHLPARRNYLSPSYLPQSLEILKDTFPKEVGKYKDVYKELKPFLSLNFPKSIVHLDLSPENCLFNKSRLAAFLDWEEVNVAPSILDIAVCIHRFCFINNIFEPALFTEFIKSYNNTRKLTSKETNNLIYAIKYVVLSTSVWLFLQHSLYQPNKNKKYRKNLYWILGINKLELPIIV